MARQPHGRLQLVFLDMSNEKILIPPLHSSLSREWVCSVAPRWRVNILRRQLRWLAPHLHLTAELLRQFSAVGRSRFISSLSIPAGNRIDVGNSLLFT